MDAIGHGEVAAAIAAGAALIAALAQGSPRPIEERARERAKDAAELTQMLPDGGPEQRIAWAVARDAVWMWGLAALPTAEEAEWRRRARVLRVLFYGALAMSFIAFFTSADLADLAPVAWVFVVLAYGLLFAHIWALRKARSHRRPIGVIPLEHGNSDAPPAPGPATYGAKDRAETPEDRRADEDTPPGVRTDSKGQGCSSESRLASRDEEEHPEHEARHDGET